MIQQIKLLLCSFVACVVLSSHGEVPEKIDFNDHVKPILSDRCFFCHGPDKKKRKGKLRLDMPDGLFKDRGGYQIIVPGKPEESELIYLITSEDEDERMPPLKSKLPKITKDELAILKKWIKEGAKWEAHWSYRPIKDQAVPETKNKKWGVNTIDQFVLSRLEGAGWGPSERANRETLIRRVTFDLTGLPPTLKAIDAYLADKSGNAFEKVVDGLLASSAYGERMASEWMDVARYSDTYGYQVDRDRYVWPWRDWVIGSFNKNMGYDDFIRWQLAGDLLENATDEQVLATTFNRLHPQKVEGGSTPEEFRVEYVADRTHTMGTAFLGLTLECSRCHSHKYDPIRHTDYYQLYAYFNNIDEAGLYSYFTPSVPTPTLRMMDAGKKGKIAAVKKKIDEEALKLNAVIEASSAGFKKWLDKRVKVDAIKGRVAHLDFEKYKHKANVLVDGPVGKGVKLSGDDAIGLKVGNFRRFNPFTVGLWLNTPDVKERAVVYHRSRAWTDAGSRGYELLIEEGKLKASLIHFWPGNAISVQTKKKIEVNKWMHVTVKYDGSSKASGLKIYIDGKYAATEVVKDHLYKNITGGGGNNIAIGERFRDRGFKGGMVDEFKVFNRELSEIEIAQLHDGKSLNALLEAGDGKLSGEQRDALFKYYLMTEDAAYQKQVGVLMAARGAMSKEIDGLREIMVMGELKKRRKSYVLARGMYDSPTEEVHPNTPEFLPEGVKGGPANRLGLANWLTSKNQPLTARVTVNRYWQLVFGDGLVRTPEDFGSQGMPPTHPKLIDWLANDFIKSGWDVKRLMKMMVMSGSYRQSSAATAKQLAEDPENRLLSRASSYRMNAEMIRDNALIAGGLLVAKVGGPSVKPYEVEQSFKPAKRDKGAGLYRRSLYTYWKRTGPAPVMMSLDASKRDVCRVKRERTSSPLQAFVMLNGPQFVEASRGLAGEMMKLHGDKDDAIVHDIFRMLTSRKPSAKELGLLVKLYRTQLAYFAKHEKEAGLYLNIGDAKVGKGVSKVRLAAFGVVANTLMNHDECVTKR